MARESTIVEFGAVDRLSPVLDRLGKGFGALNTAAGALAIGGMAALVAGVTKTISSFDRLGDAAAKLNLTTESLTKLGFAAQQSGSNAATLEKGIARLSKTIGDAIGGNATAVALFEKLGISIRDASGNARASDAVFLDVAERFKNMKDGASESAIAAELFGKTIGIDLIPLLNEGKAGIAALSDEAVRFGAVIGADAVKNAQEFKDNLDKLTVAGQSFFNGLTKELLPVLVEFSGAAADASREAGGLAASGEALGEFIKGGATAFAALAGGAELATNTFALFKAQLAGNTEEFKRLALEGARIKTEVTDRIARLQEGVFKLDTSAVSAGGSVEVLGDRVVKLGGAVISVNKPLTKTPEQLAATAKAAAESARNFDALTKAADNLALSLDKAFKDGLRPAYEKMQQFNVLTGEMASTTIPDIAVQIEFASHKFEGFGKVQTTEAASFQDNWIGATEAINDALADFISGNIDSFEDFGKALESIARQFLSNLVRQFLNTNLQVGSGGIGGVGGAGGAGGGAGGGMFGGGLGFAATGASIGYQWGGGAGAVAGGIIGLGAYGAIAGAGGLGLGIGAGSAAAAAGAAAGGGLAGAGAGAIAAVPVIGWVIAGLALLYVALQDTTRRITLVGSDVVGTPGYMNLAPGSTYASDLGGVTIASIDNVGQETRDQIGQAITDFDNTIASFLDEDQLATVTDSLAQFNSQLTEGAITAENILGERFDAILGNFSQDVQDFVNGADTLEEKVQLLQDILTRPARLNALIDSLEAIDEQSGVTELQRQLEYINNVFDDAAEAAAALGATEEQLAHIEDLRGNALDRLNQLQRDNLDALLADLQFEDATEGLSAADVAIAQINRRFDALRLQAIALGATQADLELIERRRTAALLEQADATDAATDSLNDFYDVIADAQQVAAGVEATFLDNLQQAAQSVQDWLTRGSSVSSLNPAQQLQSAQSRFETLAYRASIGDLDAIRQITGSADQFLNQAASFYGTGSAEFQRYEQLIRDVLTPIGAAASQDSMAGALIDLREVMRRLLEWLNGNYTGAGPTGSTPGVMSAATMQQIANSLDRLSRSPERAYTR